MFRTFPVLGACAALLSFPGFAQDSSGPARNFNPKISLILQGSYADYRREASTAVPGTLAGPETEPRAEGFSLGESELVLEANVDNLFRGWAALALEEEDGATAAVLEEAYAESLALPDGLALKFGRFFSDIGYQNRIHGHAWEFVDRPLVYRALLANTLGDDGVQLRWVAPTDVFIEVGAEGFRGGAFPGGGEPRSGINSWTTFLHLGGDLGVENSWRLGLSQLRAEAQGRETGEEDGSETYAFTGDSVVSILDFVYKWAQDGNPARRNAVVNAEYFHRHEDGELEFNDGVAPANSAYDGTQRGFYAQGLYQFMPRWRLGLRYDQLKSDNTVVTPAAAFDTLASGEAARRTSAMLDFSNSEFSRLRLQYNRDAARPGGEVDHQWFVQYIMSLGAHSAHQF